MNRLVLFAFLAVFTFTSTSESSAQGTAADYQRMKRLPGLARGKVFRDRLTPNWILDSEGQAEVGLWYRLSTGTKQHEFFLVDILNGQRQPAFNHGQVAKKLSEILKREFNSEALPIEGIVVDSNLKRVFFKIDDQGFEVERESGEVRKCLLSAFPKPAKSQRPAELIRSGENGQSIHVRFVNQRKSDVRLFWINQSGQLTSYGSIPAGEEKRQHTFASHAWLVLDASGNPLEMVRAENDGQRVVVGDRSTVRVRIPRRRNSRRSRFPRAATTSPDGRFKIQIDDHNVVLQDLQKKKQQEAASEDSESPSKWETQITEDGREFHFYSNQCYWSPDSSKVVVVKERPGKDRQIHLIESSPSDQLQPKLHSMTYAKPGDRIRTRRPVLIDVESSKVIPVDDDLFENPWRLHEYHWSDDSSEFRFRVNQRGHQAMRIVGINAETGTARALVDETVKTFIDYNYKFKVHYLPKTDEVIWSSERDGWNHLYLYDLKTGQLKNQITRGPWLVRKIDRVDEELRQIWFQAGGIHSTQDPYYVHHCRIDFSGENLTILTGGDGTHEVAYSPTKKFLIDTWSRVDLPPVNELRNVETGKMICRLAAGEDSALREAGFKRPIRFLAPGRDGQTRIFGVIYRPTNFDPEKKYPVIEYIYAGPHGSFVPKSYQAYRRTQALAELGFVVVQIDGMGTSNRSKKFHDVCWKNLGDSGFPDRKRWIAAAAQKYPWMDTSRVGIFGGSAGGQSTLRALLAHGDFYHVGVADCGCHDNRMDKIWWNEQWMGWPIGPHYKEQSNVTQAHKLQGKLMLIVGEMDRNVDPSSTLQVVNALIKADKDFDFLLVPGGGHGVGSRPYGRRRTCDFFVRHLLNVEPRFEEN